MSNDLLDSQGKAIIGDLALDRFATYHEISLGEVGSNIVGVPGLTDNSEDLPTTLPVKWSGKEIRTGDICLVHFVTDAYINSSDISIYLTKTRYLSIYSKLLNLRTQIIAGKGAELLIEITSVDASMITGHILNMPERCFCDAYPYKGASGTMLVTPREGNVGVICGDDLSYISSVFDIKIAEELSITEFEKLLFSKTSQTGQFKPVILDALCVNLSSQVEKLFSTIPEKWIITGQISTRKSQSISLGDGMYTVAAKLVNGPGHMDRYPESHNLTVANGLAILNLEIGSTHVTQVIFQEITYTSYTNSNNKCYVDIPIDSLNTSYPIQLYNTNRPGGSDWISYDLQIGSVIDGTGTSENIFPRVYFDIFPYTLPYKQ